MVFYSCGFRLTGCCGGRAVREGEDRRDLHRLRRQGFRNRGDATPTPGREGKSRVVAIKRPAPRYPSRRIAGGHIVARARRRRRCRRPAFRLALRRWPARADRIKLRAVRFFAEIRGEGERASCFRPRGLSHLLMEREGRPAGGGGSQRSAAFRKASAISTAQQTSSISTPRIASNPARPKIINNYGNPTNV